ncbi:MAG TPA: low molecular weight protein tyrosine phosphatase family protein [Allosphingosinicella sp.]
MAVDDGSGVPRIADVRHAVPIAPMKKILFLCSQNRLRSPTAEQVFASHPGIEVASAGLNNDAENPTTPELIAWADLIFVMEKAHRNRLQKRFRQHLKARVICLDIPDEYEFMDKSLISLLKAKVSRHLPI